MSDDSPRHRDWWALFEIALGLFVLLSANVRAQVPPPRRAVTIASTERRVLKSTVNGVEYEVDVALPRGYAASQKDYPVVYTLDGNTAFPLLTASYRQITSLIPQELIVVGIGYPVKDYLASGRSEYLASRARDYTPATIKSGIGTEGGAPAFLRFLREELIPFIDSNYRTVPGDRGLFGHSYGGLFCAYVLTHEPGLFQKYAIGSPALWWDHETGIRWESEYAAKHTDLPARVYVYVGESEDENTMKAPIRRFCAALKARHYAGLDLVDFVVVPGETHSSVVLGSMEHALRALYGQRSVSLPVGLLGRYVGEWKTGDEPSWTTRLDRERLFIDVPSLRDADLSRAPETRELRAESETSFFTELGDMSIDFTLDPATKSAIEMRVTIPRIPYSSVLRRVPAKAADAPHK